MMDTAQWQDVTGPMGEYTEVWMLDLGGLWRARLYVMLTYDGAWVGAIDSNKRGMQYWELDAKVLAAAKEKIVALYEESK